MDQVELGYRAFQSINVPAAVIDREGRLVLFTPEFRDRYFENTTGVPNAINEIFGGNSTDIAKEVRNTQAGIAIVLVKVSTKKTIRESFVITPLREGTRRPTHYLLCRTEHTALDQGFIALNAELEKANKEAAKARVRRQYLENENKHLLQYAGIAAHDLKAPLRNMRGFLSILVEDYSSQLDEEAKDIVEHVRTSASRLHKLIEDLLAHSKSANQPLQFESLSIREIVDRVTENLSKSIAETNAKIIIGQLDNVIEGDPILVHQLFENLIGNSIKYRSQVRDPQINIRLTEDNHLEFEDNGLGFDNQHREQLFEPFKRLHSESEIEGTGLGLATCKSICDRHGWTISASGKATKGSKFTIYLQPRQ